MNKSILFEERQRFKQWWLWILLLGINGLFIFGVLKQVAGGQQFGNQSMDNTVLLVVTGFTLLLTGFFLSSRLDTKIREDGIYVRFTPFHFSFKHYTWEELTKSYIRQYSALSEYGGWGLRTGFSGKGMAYNVSGDNGLQLEFTSGKKLLIGTNKPDQLAEVLSKMGQLKS